MTTGVCLQGYDYRGMFTGERAIHQMTTGV